MLATAIPTHISVPQTLIISFSEVYLFPCLLLLWGFSFPRCAPFMGFLLSHVSFLFLRFIFFQVCSFSVVSPFPGMICGFSFSRYVSCLGVLTFQVCSADYMFLGILIFLGFLIQQVCLFSVFFPLFWVSSIIGI
jgi:hypothetical protein